MSYKIYNAPMPTTAGIAAQTTGTVIKTMLQVAAPSTRMLEMIAWGYNLASLPGSGPNLIELLETDGAATGIAHDSSGKSIYKTDPNGSASAVLLGGSTTATIYSASTEGSITTVRMFDADEVTPTAGGTPTRYAYQFLPDERPVVAASHFLRIRATFASAVNMLCWAAWREI